MADVASLVFDIDTSRARTAASDLAKVNDAAAKVSNQWSKTDSAIRKANGQFEKSSVVAAKYGNEVRRLAQEFNPALNAVYQYQEAQERLSRAVALGVLSQSQAEASLERLTVQYGQSASAANRFGNAQRSTGHHTANVFSQLNDIGVMLAAGQNPIQLALQQGTQLNQVWTSMGASGRTLGGVFGVLRGAVASMLSPMSLLTIGTIAATAALTKWVTEAVSAGSENKKLSEQYEGLAEAASSYAASVRLVASPMTELNEKFGTQAQRMRELYEIQARLKRLEFAETLKTANEKLITTFGGLTESVARLEQAMSLPDYLRSEGVQIIREEMERLNREFGIGSADARSFANELAALSQATGPEDAAESLKKVVDRLITAKERGGDVPPELIRVAQEAATAAGMVLELTSALQSAGVAASNVSLPVSAGMTFGSGGWAAGLYGKDFLPPTREPPKVKVEKSGGRAVKQAEKQFQSIRELLEKETVFQFAEYEKRHAQLTNALNREQITKDQYAKIDQQLRTMYFGTEYAQRQVEYDMSLEQLRRALELEYLTRQEYEAKKTQLQWQYANSALDLNSTQLGAQLNGLAGYFSQASSLAGGGYSGLLKAQQAFAASSALISAYSGAAQALADPTLTTWQKIAAAGKVLTTGLGFVSAIKSGGNAGGSGGVSSSVATQQAEPMRQTTVRIEGDTIFSGMMESIVQSLWDRSKDGELIIYQGGR